MLVWTDHGGRSGAEVLALPLTVREKLGGCVCFHSEWCAHNERSWSLCLTAFLRLFVKNSFTLQSIPWATHTGGHSRREMCMKKTAHYAGLLYFMTAAARAVYFTVCREQWEDVRLNLISPSVPSTSIPTQTESQGPPMAPWTEISRDFSILSERLPDFSRKFKGAHINNIVIYNLNQMFQSK